MIPLVIIVAPTGAQRTKAEHPALPLAPAEIADEALRCCAAGATVVHLHVRDAAGRHSLDPERYRAAIEALREALGERMVVQVSTAAGGRYRVGDQMTVVRQLHPDAVSLRLDELVPDLAAAGEAAAFLHWLKRERIAPQYILRTPNDVARLQALRRRGVIPQRRPFALFSLGRYNGSGEVRPRDMLPYLKAHDASCPWALCAFGPGEAACVLTAAGLGGHARVGFEHNLWRSDGALAASNAELVEQVVAGARLLGREPADITTTRELLAATAS